MNGTERHGPGKDILVTGMSDAIRPEVADSSSGAELELEQLRASIRETEHGIVEIFQTIQDRLSMENILKQTGEKARDAVVGRIEIMASRLSESRGNIGNETMEMIKAHPGTTALVGMGLGFLLVNGIWGRSGWKKGTHQGTYTGIEGNDAGLFMHPEHGKRGSVFVEEDRANEQGSTGEMTGETAEAPGGTREEPHRILGKMSERATEIGSKARHTARSTQDRASRLVDERPLVLGVLGLAAGLAAGMMCSGAFREKGFAREARETIRRKTHGFVGEARERAERVVQEVGNVARKEAERQHLILPEQRGDDS